MSGEFYEYNEALKASLKVKGMSSTSAAAKAKGKQIVRNSLLLITVLQSMNGYDRSFSSSCIRAFSLMGMTFSFTYYLITNSNAIANAQTLTTSSSPSTDAGLPTIQIVSPHDGQLVPPGELTIQEISSDNEQADCQVYADVNDITPMLRVTTAGDSGEALDFSKWTFTYTEDYQLIKEGENELTAKISCFDDYPCTIMAKSYP